jgi:GNAT superfamily N-acetyltransferase
MPYSIVEADTESSIAIETIHRFNSLDPETFPPLTQNHLDYGFWWFAYSEGEVVAFAGLVEKTPFRGVGYMKRAYVMPDHRGHGLQLRMLFSREARARELGWKQLVSECAAGSRSAANFQRAGYEQVFPEQPWGKPGSIYWAKQIA